MKNYSHSFLKPIDPKKPSGEYLRYESEYDEFNLFESQAKTLFTETVADQADIWAAAEKIKINWSDIIKKCESLLKARTKDLQIVYWLILAKSKQEGIQGMLDGLLLFNAIMSEFWDTCHPAADEDADYAIRLGVINRLRSQLPFFYSIFQLSKSKEGKGFNYLDYQMAVSQSASDLTEEDVSQAFSNTNQDFFDHFFKTHQACVIEVKKIDDFLAEKDIGDDSSSNSTLQGMDRVISVIPSTNTSVFESIEEVHQPELAGRSSAQAAAVNAINLIDASINSRGDAFLTLQKISKVLKRIEPHTIVTPIIDQIFEWENTTPQKIDQELQDRGFSLLDLMKMFPETMNKK